MRLLLECSCGASTRHRPEPGPSWWGRVHRGVSYRPHRTCPNCDGTLLSGSATVSPGAAAADDGPGPPPAPSPSGDGSRCPACRAKVRPSWETCRKCARPLTRPPSGARASKGPPPRNAVQCLNCGALRAPDADACPSCGDDSIGVLPDPGPVAPARSTGRPDLGRALARPSPPPSGTRLTLTGVDLRARYYDPRPVLIAWAVALATVAAISILAARAQRSAPDWLIAAWFLAVLGPPHLLALVRKRFLARWQDDGRIEAEESLWFGPIRYSGGEVDVSPDDSLRLATLDRSWRYATRGAIAGRRWIELPHVILCFALLSCVVTPLLAGFFMRFFVPSWRLASVGSEDNELPFDVRLVEGPRDYRTLGRELVKGDALAAAQALHALLALELKVERYGKDDRPPPMQGPRV